MADEYARTNPQDPLDRLRQQARTFAALIEADPEPWIPAVDWLRAVAIPRQEIRHSSIGPGVSTVSSFIITPDTPSRPDPLARGYGYRLYDVEDQATSRFGEVPRRIAAAWCDLIRGIERNDPSDDSWRGTFGVASAVRVALVAALTFDFDFDGECVGLGWGWSAESHGKDAGRRAVETLLPVDADWVATVFRIIDEAERILAARTADSARPTSPSLIAEPAVKRERMVLLSNQFLALSRLAIGAERVEYHRDAPQSRSAPFRHDSVAQRLHWRANGKPLEWQQALFCLAGRTEGAKETAVTFAARARDACNLFGLTFGNGKDDALHCWIAALFDQPGIEWLQWGSARFVSDRGKPVKGLCWRPVKEVPKGGARIAMIDDVASASAEAISRYCEAIRARGGDPNPIAAADEDRERTEPHRSDYATDRAIAEKHNVSLHNLRSRLNRWRARNMGDWHKDDNPKRGESKYKYRVAAIIPIITDMKSCDERM